jgi:flagellar basal-body rod protein FlgB
MQIFGPVIQGLGTTLGLYHARHRVLAENIANAETPGYRARDLDFGSELANAFETDPAHTPGQVGEPAADTKAAVKIDRNSVDLDIEMARISQNDLKIRALSQILARRFSFLKSAIDGSK